MCDPRSHVRHFKPAIYSRLSFSKYSKFYSRPSDVFSCFSKKSRILIVLFFVAGIFSFSGNAQSFEISTDGCDSLSPTSYMMSVSGYATFTDSMTLTIELISADSTNTIVYTGSKDFGVGGLNTLTNFIYDSSSEEFSLDIGTYSSQDYKVRIRSWVNSEMKEELILDTY